MKILLADDHELFTEGFSLLLNNLFKDCPIKSATSWLGAKQLTKKTYFDLAILDLFMPAPNSWDKELAEFIDLGNVGTVCVLTSSMNQNNVNESFALGVKGYIHKSSSFAEIRKALGLTLEGKVYLPPQLMQSPERLSADYGCSKLTPRQHKILTMIAEGKENRSIACGLGIRESTVKRHVYNIFQQLGASNRTEATHIARQQGLLRDI